MFNVQVVERIAFVFERQGQMFEQRTGQLILTVTIAGAIDQRQHCARYVAQTALTEPGQIAVGHPRGKPERKNVAGRRFRGRPITRIHIVKHDHRHAKLIAGTTQLLNQPLPIGFSRRRVFFADRVVTMEQ